MFKLYTMRALCLAGLTVAMGTFAHAQDEKENADPGAAAFAAYLEQTKPGPEHAKLKMRVGRWNVAGMFYMAPGAPPMKTQATSVIRPILGGRFFREQYSSEIMGMKFTGIGVQGYDKGLKKYVYTWADSMSTYLTRSEGTSDDSGNVITFVGQHFDQMKNGVVKTKATLELTSRKTHTMRMFEVSADGSERKVMEFVYTRAKGGGKKAAGKGEKKPGEKKNKKNKKNKKKDEDGNE